jgi:hypothetical protein
VLRQVVDVYARALRHLRLEAAYWLVRMVKSVEASQRLGSGRGEREAGQKR